MTDPFLALKKAVAGRGGRWTRARERVLEVFLKDRRPLTAREIHRRAGAKANLASVYRNIRLLCELGLLISVDRVAEGERFELSESYRNHHHHLICERCGAVEDLEGCLLKSAVRNVQARTRFRIVRHELNLYGLCLDCAA